MTCWVITSTIRNGRIVGRRDNPNMFHVIIDGNKEPEWLPECIVYHSLLAATIACDENARYWHEKAIAMDSILRNGPWPA